MKKKHKIIMLPTEGSSSLTKDERGALFLRNIKSKAKLESLTNQHLYILSNYEIKVNDYVFLEDDDPFEKNHLIIRVTDAEIGMGESSNSTIAFSLDDVKKVLATTDPKLKKFYNAEGTLTTNKSESVSYIKLPQIPQSFIEYYAKHQLEYIELEYTCKSVKNDKCEYCIEEGDSCNNYKLKLVTNEVVWVEPESYIQKCGRIKRVSKEKLYTREEVEKIALKAIKWANDLRCNIDRKAVFGGNADKEVKELMDTNKWLKENL